MHAALQEHFGDIARWTDPEGGFFLWVTLENGVDTAELFEIALAEGVAFIPGPAFSPTGRFTDALRLCFASTTAGPNPRRHRPPPPSRRQARLTAPTATTRQRIRASPDGIAAKSCCCCRQPLS